MSIKLSGARKAVVATVLGVITAVVTVLGGTIEDGTVDASEIITVVLAGLTAAGVYRIPNAPRPDDES